MNGKLYYKNVALNLTTQESRTPHFLDYLYAGLSVLKFALKLSPALAIAAFMLLIAGCSSSDIERAGNPDGGNGQAQDQLLIDNFEPSNGGPCALSDKWSSWSGIKLGVSPYGDDPPDKVRNPEGNDCYLKIEANSDPESTSPGTVMIYIGKNVDPNGYLTFDLRIDKASGDSAEYGQITFELVDDDNIPYTINIDLSDFTKGGDDLFSYIYTNTNASMGDWVRVSIPLSNFLDTNSSLGDNLLNTGTTPNPSPTSTSDAGSSDASVSTSSSQNNGGLLALRVTPRDPNMVLSFDNLRISTDDDSSVLATVANQQNPDGGTDADVIESPDAGPQDDGGYATPDGDLDGGTSSDAGNDGGSTIPDADDGGSVADGGTDAGFDPALYNPPYTIDDSEGIYDWYSWDGATGSFVLSASTPTPSGGLILGSYVLSVNGTVNNGATYPGGIGRYNGRSAGNSDFLTFSVAGQGAFRLIVADHDDGIGIDYFQSNSTFSSDTGQYALNGWRTYSVPFSAFTLDTQQNTYTGESLGDSTFNPTVSADSDGLQKVHITLQTNTEAQTNSQVHLYFDNVQVTTTDQGDGIADVVLSNSSPFPVDNFDDGNFSSNPAWFSGDGMTIDIVEYALAGIIPPPTAGTHFVTLHGSNIPAALYGGYFGAYVGKKVSPNTDIFKFNMWDLNGRLAVQLEFEMDDGTTKQFRYVFEEHDEFLGGDPTMREVGLTTFGDNDGHAINFYPTTDPEGKYTLKNVVFILEGSAIVEVEDTTAKLDSINIEP